MAADIFDKLISKGVRAGQVPARTESARTWFRKAAQGVTTVKEAALLKDKSRATTRPLVGQMYMFSYDPKHKETLPYYDTLPLIFPIETFSGGFYGINMHYLPLPLRAKLMDALYDLTNNKRYDESTKLKLSYQILKGITKARYFKPCLKMYLTNHVKSQFMHVHPSEWDIALFLPTARFAKKSMAFVHSESRKMIT